MKEIKQEWISVNDRLPDHSNGFKKYKVKMLVGSIDVKEVESIVLGKMYSTGFRFIVGDWQKVMQWMDYEEPQELEGEE